VAVAALQSEGFRISKVDLRGKSPLIEQYRIRRNPTFIYLVQEKEVRRATGNQSKATLRNLFRKSIF
jgi:hypothetical protein